MTLSTFDSIAAITAHSAGFAEATRGNLDARVEHCPDWTVADLVWHLTEVHWFWATIAEERPTAPPERSRRPERPADADLVDAFVAGAARLVQVLREADQSASCWTWAPLQQDVAFVTRHQVQEAAVHHWDAVNAAGGRLVIDTGLAVDAVEEFLTFSVSSDADPADPPRPALDAAVWFDTRASAPGSPTWLVTDGTAPGTLAWRRLPDDVEPVDAVPPGTTLSGGPCDPADVLLWLYARRPRPWIDGSDDPADDAVLGRFRALTFTD